MQKANESYSFFPLRPTEPPALYGAPPRSGRNGRRRGRQGRRGRLGRRLRRRRKVARKTSEAVAAEQLQQSIEEERDNSLLQLLL